MLLLAFLLVVSFGALVLGLSQYGKLKYPFKNEFIRDATIRGKVTDINLKREGKILFELQSSLIRKGEWEAKGKFKFRVLVRDGASSLDYLYSKLAIGDSIEMLGTVQRVPRKMNPGEFDYEKYLLNKGIVGEISCNDAFNVTFLKPPKFSFLNFVFTLRKELDNALRKLYFRNAYVLLRGLLLADRSEIPNEVKTNFVNAGVVHVLAVSGLHVGFLLLIFLLLFNRFNLYLRYLLTLAGLFLFTLLTGMPTSVVRASLMAAVSILSYLLNRDYNVLNSVAIAAVVILLFKPAEIFSPGFQLSFAAVLSLIFFAPIVTKGLRQLGISNKYLYSLLSFLGVTFSAQIGTLPFVLAYFGKLSIVSLVANLFVIPLVGIVISVGILSLLFLPISYFLGSVFALTNSFFVFLLYKITELAGSFKYAYLSITQFTLYDSLVYFSSLFALFILFKKVKNGVSRLAFFSLLVFLFYFLITLDNKEFFPRESYELFVPETYYAPVYLVNSASAGKLFFCFDVPQSEYYRFRLLQLLNSTNVEQIDSLYLTGENSNVVSLLLSFRNKIKIRKLFLPKENLLTICVERLKNYLGIKSVTAISFADMSERNHNPFLWFFKSRGTPFAELVLKGKRIFLLPALTFTKFKNLTKPFRNVQADLVALGVKNFRNKWLPLLQTARAKLVIINIIGRGENFLQKISPIYLTDEAGAVLLKFKGNKVERIFW